MWFRPNYWISCKNCSWITKEIKTEPKNNSLNKKRKKTKNCLECQKALNFLEPEKGKYLCGKNKCLRSYIEQKSEQIEKGK